MGRRCGGVYERIPSGSALVTRSRIAIAQADFEQAERDAYDALVIVTDIDAQSLTPELLECLARVGVCSGAFREAARLFGSAASAWQRIGATRYKVHQVGFEASVAVLRDAMKDMTSGSVGEGAALSNEEAIAMRSAAAVHVSGRRVGGRR